MSRFQFVADHRSAYCVKRLCQVLGISRSGFYLWQAAAGKRAAKAAADAVLTERIRAIHTASARTYGVPRITAELRGAGTRANHKRVERLMREHRIAGVHLRRRHRTTIADPGAPRVADLLEHDFTAAAPNQRYVGDITYLVRRVALGCIPRAAGRKGRSFLGRPAYLEPKGEGDHSMPGKRWPSGGVQGRGAARPAR